MFSNNNLILCFLIVSLLLLLGCEQLSGEKGRSNLKGTLSVDGELSLIDEEGNQQIFKTDILKMDGNLS